MIMPSGIPGNQIAGLSQISGVDGWSGLAVDFVTSGSGRPVILSAIAEKLKRRSKDDFKGRHFEASLILQAVSWYLRYPPSLGQSWSIRSRIGMR
jgi:hypothetical protein